MSVKIYLMHSSQSFGVELTFNDFFTFKEKSYSLVKEALIRANDFNTDKIISVINLLKTTSSFHYAKLVLNSDVTIDNLRINLLNDDTVSVCNNGFHLWQGKISQMPTWSILNKGVDEYKINKTIMFNYYGGSNCGGKRIVKVLNVNKDIVYGIDLEKDEERSYIKSKIKNLKVLT